MVFKGTTLWRACYDEVTGRYTAEAGGGMAYDLYEITKEIFDQLDPDVETVSYTHLTLPTIYSV